MQRAEVDWIKADSTDTVLTGQSLSMSLCVPLCIALSLSLSLSLLFRKTTTTTLLCTAQQETFRVVTISAPTRTIYTVCSFHTVIFSDRRPIPRLVGDNSSHLYHTTHVPYLEAAVLYINPCWCWPALLLRLTVSFFGRFSRFTVKYF